VTKEG